MKSRILIVDDSPTDLKVLGNVLHEEYAVSMAVNGQQAMDLVVRECPDLVLLDIIMPGMDGFAVIEALRAEPATRGIPVIFLTVVDALEEKVRGFGCGAVDYILKPFEPLEVRARVKTHVALSRARKQLAEQNERLQQAARLREEVEALYRHDLKNPLGSILGGCDLLLLGGELSKQQRETLAIVQKAGLTMLDIINRYFDLFRIEQGFYALRPVAIDIIQILRRVVKDMSGRTRGRDLTVLLEYQGEICPPESELQLMVRGEEMLCYSMFANLFKNALEASTAGNVVTLSVSDDDCCQVAITNQGEVPEKIRQTFFEKYVSAEKEHGTGLGTYSARKIAELLSGSIRLDTSIAGKTVVLVRLPLWRDGGEIPCLERKKLSE